MKKITRCYYYLFYIFYKFSEAAPSRWASDWKAGLVIMVLEIWLTVSFLNYYNVFVDRYFNWEITSPVVLISGFIIFALNYYAFVYLDVWKDYVKQYNRLPKAANRRGSLITIGIVLLVLGNLLFSFYLVSKIDWAPYR